MATPLPPGFQGRSGERGVLDRLVETVREGHSAVLLIRGEAGVGKTALLHYVAEQASDFRVAEIAGVEAEMELPFAGLHRLCTPMLGHLDQLPKPQEAALRVALGLSSGDAPDRFLVALAALSLISEFAEARPLLCLVDDVQWLDAATEQVLGFVARRLLAESVAMVFAVREANEEHALVGLPEMTLRGLEEYDARALLATVIPGRLDEGVSDRIAAESRGNPLALLELSDRVSAADLAGGYALPTDGDLPRHIEAHYLARVATLPPMTQRLILLAAADPVGDAALLWRAAQILGIGQSSAESAAQEQLLDIGARVRFRHPLVRSAVYGAASADDRRAVHAALAAATDRQADPDRRAWHKAQAAEGPDEEVARELLRCASSAERRGGIAASAAFLERAVVLTPDARLRASRALAAASAKFEAGAFAAAEALLATADAGPLDELGQAQVQRIRAQIAFDLRRGGDAPLLLLNAARRFEGLDDELAYEAYLEALIAAVYASSLAIGTDVAGVAAAARLATGGTKPLPTRQLLLLGLTTRFTDGYAAAAPTLTRAVIADRATERHVDWVGVAYMLAAMELWDDQAWFDLASRQADLARSTGALTLLPYALDYLAGFHIQAGQLSMAAGLLTEAEGLILGIRADTLPYTSLRLAAWRGEASTALHLVEVLQDGGRARGEGCAITAADYAAAILHNGLGQYELALEAAQRATVGDDIVTSSWALPELVEAASRCGQPEIALDTVKRLSERALAAGTHWAMGMEARARALVESGDTAEELHRQAIEWLGGSRMAAHLARARLNYGEWLRRENRRVDARQQLRDAHDAFVSMGAQGFAERARHELLATGEKVRKRRDDTRDDLTPQEERIARLARDGRTNPEIGAELFLSSRTVEWHLRKIFTKLGISSRKGLRTGFPPGNREGTAPVVARPR